MLNLVAGLGNPGSEYENTRHNIGFLLLDYLAEKRGGSFLRKKNLSGMVMKDSFKEREFLYLKPETYMNLSGLSVRKALNYYKAPSKNVIIIVDDMDLPFGKIRVRGKGKSGGHNGLKSVEEELQTDQYGRIRFGVMNEHLALLKKHKSHLGIRDFVLSPFTKDEKEKLPDLFSLAEKAMLEFVLHNKTQTLSLMEK